jgi:periplasmic protein TonB
MLRVLIAVTGALAVNFALLFLVSLLSQERAVEQNEEYGSAIRLVSLSPPEIQDSEPEPEPEKPKQEKQSDFQPDLTPPSLTTPQFSGPSLAIDMSIGTSGKSTDFIFNAAELDHPPRVISRVPPVYPYKAKQREIEGSVDVKFLVDESGAVKRITILKSKPKGLFEDSVTKMLPRWKFDPGQIDGVAVSSWVITTIRFELES